MTFTVRYVLAGVFDKTAAAFSGVFDKTRSVAVSLDVSVAAQTVVYGGDTVVYNSDTVIYGS